MKAPAPMGDGGTSIPRTVPSAIQVFEGWAGSRDYEGTRAELIEAGLARCEWFPDGDKAWKSSRTVRLEDGRKVSIFNSRRRKGDFRVYYRATEGEKQAELDRERSESSRANAEYSARQRAERRLTEMPCSEAAFRNSASSLPLLGDLCGLVWGHVSQARGGYAFTAAALECIRESLMDLDTAIKSAEVTFSEKRRAVETSELRGRVLGRSVEFERFMVKSLGQQLK